MVKAEVIQELTLNAEALARFAAKDSGYKGWTHLATLWEDGTYQIESRHADSDGLLTKYRYRSSDDLYQKIVQRIPMQIENTILENPCPESSTSSETPQPQS